jgi:class 3 adenylate cyclase/tetratricopeptide (TPR) repeat protein
MAACPSCSRDVPGEFAFCPHCGAALTAPSGRSARERKVVSVLFCDLVGFTAAAESADPEEVAARVAPYHAAVRDRIEAFGGTVEKFVGDAVMAVFGAPVAHEDDAERAVRAGLAVLETIDDLNRRDASLELSVRVGVNTGEAVVALEARPGLGEGMVTGDVVNTAARIQAQAPVDAVAVGEETFRSTERVFEYEQLEPILAKGKTRPVAVWRAVAARARFGSDVIRSMTTPLVGREVDLALLRGAFEKTVAETSVHVVTVAGEPGVGKSRLVAELGAYVDALHEVVRWRQGRCLPYGEGITFWALGEIVKAQAGIYESDSPDQAAAKLAETIPPGDDASWIRARLLPLVGVEPGIATREESFTAWRRYLESMADDGPAVLVFEDVHWADDALLAFLEHLADWAQGVALLIVCTTRPELYERHATWCAGLRNATTVSLTPLSDNDTARLVAALLEQAVLPADTQALLLERAGGNPLYAEEFVRMLRDRELVDAHGRLRAGAEVPFPDSIHALIAARLDTLAPDAKGLLQDAAVIGKVFWAGAVASMGERDGQDVERALHALARKELVRPFRRSSMEGDSELGFWHALVRDVAYAQIPRAERAEKHVRAVAWLEETAGDRVEDLAEVLAYHTGEASALAEATGDSELAAELAPAVRRYALLAGERALGLDTGNALRLLQRALETTPDDDPAFPAALLSWSRAAFPAGDLMGAAGALERAVQLFRDRGDVEGAATALGELSTVHSYQGDPRSTGEAEEAVALLEDRPGAALVGALTGLAGTWLVNDEPERCAAVAGRALDLAEELGLPLPLKALGFRGGARVGLGDADGLAELERARDLLVAGGGGRDAVVMANNFAVNVYEIEGPAGGVSAHEAAIALAEARGVTTAALHADYLGMLVDVGRLQEVVEAGVRVRDECLAQGFTARAAGAAAATARALCETGATAEALTLATATRDQLRDGLQPALVEFSAGELLEVFVAAGRRDNARSLLEQVAADDTISWDVSQRLAAFVRGALAVGDVELGTRICERASPHWPMFQAGVAAGRAHLAEADGDPDLAAARYAEVAERWRGLGARLEEGYAVLGRGRCLAALGNPAAAATLHEARRLFAAMGAHARVEECDLLLAQVSRLSS